MTMTPEQIAAAWALVNAATKGPWLVSGETLFGRDFGYTVGLFNIDPYFDNDRHQDDAAFIAASRELVPEVPQRL